MSNSSLTVVGLGIKFLSHLSVEAKLQIEQSEKLLYLVNEPLTEKWLQSVNPSSESLNIIYTRHPRRLDSYREITAYILETLLKYKIVCVVLYGHPTVFAQPALEAAKIAKARKISVRILPAISAEDCLFADLMIDPGSCGCQSFEATDFLIHRRMFDKNSHLILWQVGIIGNVKHVRSENGDNGISILIKYIKKFYPEDHEVIIYEASLYPHFEPRVEIVELANLLNVRLTRVSTLYIPPLQKSDCDNELLTNLGLVLEDLQ